MKRTEDAVFNPEIQIIAFFCRCDRESAAFTRKADGVIAAAVYGFVSGCDAEESFRAFFRLITLISIELPHMNGVLK